jgi:hypothetical protein
MNNSALPNGLDYTLPLQRSLSTRERRRENISPTKIQRNPLITLDSDEIVRDFRNIKDLSGG